MVFGGIYGVAERQNDTRFFAFVKVQLKLQLKFGGEGMVVGGIYGIAERQTATRV